MNPNNDRDKQQPQKSASSTGKPTQNKPVDKEQRLKEDSSDRQGFRKDASTGQPPKERLQGNPKYRP